MRRAWKPVQAAGAAAAAAAEAAAAQAPLARGTPAAGWVAPAASGGREQRAFSAQSAQGSGASADAGGKQGSAQPERSKVLVIGGSGFVGSAVCEAVTALGKGEVQAVSLSRTGLPAGLEKLGHSWISQVEWRQGDVFQPEQWKALLPSASAVVSCVGAFGSREHMRRVNGQANVIAAQAAADAGVPRFVFISAHDFGLLGKIIPAGYYEGKQMAERAIQEFFPETGYILRPGMIYGSRLVGNVQIPLQLVGAPLDTVFSVVPWITSLPLVGPALIPPIPVGTVGRAAAKAALGKSKDHGRLDVWQMKQLAA